MPSVVKSKMSKVTKAVKKLAKPLAKKIEAKNGHKNGAKNGVKAALAKVVSAKAAPAKAAGKAGRRTYFFGGGKAEGNKEMKNLLGGKGANLAEMANIGLPVPPGFTITTDVCVDFYKTGKKWPKGLDEEVKAAVVKMEKLVGAKFGDPANPLLVSVRSGARASMPGMMDTI